MPTRPQAYRSIAYRRPSAEACITVRKLSLRYFWIDLLRIVQGLTGDKTIDISKMADYHQGADLNLSASSGKLSGLWSERDGAAARPFATNAALVSPGSTKQK